MQHRSDSERNAAPEAEERVGYKRPPKHTRFKPGQPGNAKGRPRGARGRATIVREIANEVHRVMENGTPQWRSTLELVLLSVRNRAMTGNVRAFRAVHELLERYGPQEPQRRGGFLIIHEPLPQEEWERRAAEHQRPYRERPAR